MLYRKVHCASENSSVTYTAVWGLLLITRAADRVSGIANVQLGISLVWQSARYWTIVGMGLTVVQGLMPLAVLYLTKLTVDAVTTSIQASHKDAAFLHVLGLLCVTGGAMLVTAVCISAANIIREHQSQQVTDHVTEVIHQHSSALDLAYYEDARYHDTLYRAQREAASRPNSIVQSLTQLFQNLVSLIALAGFLLFLEWWIAVVLFVAAVPAMMVRIHHSKRLFAWHSKRTTTERTAAEFHEMLTSAGHAKEVRLFGLGEVFRKRYRDVRRLLRRERLGLLKSRAVYDLIAQAGTMLSVFALLVFIVWLTIRGTMTMGDMVMYYQAFQRAQGILQQIMGGLASLYEDSLFLSNLSAFLDMKPRVAEPVHPVAVPRPMRDGIVMENVCFQYPSRRKTILKGICLTIRAGETVALLGDNGSGKTTLAKLLCRFYDPTSGRITLDGVDLRHYGLQALRKEVTMIFQDYIHYALTARENIWVGDVGLSLEDDAVIRAAKWAGADQLIRKLPKGYDTILGNRFEKGIELSHGEWQKIALARAFLRDAQLIILDEPTSSMSVQAEYEVFQTTRELLGGRSALLISHRFSTVKMADRICLLADGMIAEQGTHDELMRLGGHYAGLYDLQTRQLSRDAVSG
jgi:ATP-binding cassette, subfamily B, bacterial